MENSVTIIIPSREEDFLLDECILKIRELYKKVKIIIVLDKITDKNYGENVQKIKSDNKNMSAKRNLGVKNANTKYIALLDSDAYPAKNWIEKSVSFLDNNKNYSAVTGRQYNMPSDSFTQLCLRLVRFSKLFTHSSWCIITDENAKEQDCSEFSSANVIMTKSVWDKLNGMNENIYLAEDNEFSSRFQQNNFKIRFIPEAAIFHRESEMYPFLRKLWCMGYYYSDMFKRGKSVKTFKQSLVQFFPLFASFCYLLLWLLFLYFNINFIPLLILPIFPLLILIFEAVNLTKKLKEKKLKGFFIILFTFCAFIFVWIISSFAGLISLPSKNVRDLYKHY